MKYFLISIFLTFFFYSFAYSSNERGIGLVLHFIINYNSEKLQNAEYVEDFAIIEEVRVCRVYEGSPAEKQGIEIRDKVLSLNGISLSGKTMTEIDEAYQKAFSENASHVLLKIKKTNGKHRYLLLPILSFDLDNYKGCSGDY